ncbi:MAG: hypothetical protein M9928_08590 [Anaerolineae bacterium]|nr:hypothetical protein [Anaerolineae bacterium]
MPGLHIVGVNEDSTVTIRATNLPVNQLFKVRMGARNSLGENASAESGYTVVTNLNSGSSGTVTAELRIPQELADQTANSELIDIRIDSLSGTSAVSAYAFNQFLNRDFNNGVGCRTLDANYKVAGTSGMYYGPNEALPFTAGADPSTDGADPSTDGADPSTDGADPSTDGADPSTDGADPSTDGADPSTDGADPSTDGADPSTDGADPSTDGADPSTDGADPSTESTRAGSTTVIQVKCVEKGVSVFVFVPPSYFLPGRTVTAQLGDATTEPGLGWADVGAYIPNDDGSLTIRLDIPQAMRNNANLTIRLENTLGTAYRSSYFPNEYGNNVVAAPAMPAQ